MMRTGTAGHALTLLSNRLSRFVAAYHEHGWPAHYDQTNDQFVFSMKHAGGDDNEVYSPVEEEGLKLYPQS